MIRFTFNYDQKIYIKMHINKSYQKSYLYHINLKLTYIPYLYNKNNDNN